MGCVFNDTDVMGRVECDLTPIAPECRCDYVDFDPLCTLNSRVNYLHFPACTAVNMQIWAIVALGSWTVYLFSALAVIVEHGVVTNLVQMSKILNLSEVVAGVTLLALGNGISDIFTAISAVRSSPNGGALAVSGLLGSALFVIAVNTAVITINYEPKANWDLLSRDSFFFVISLGWVAYMLWDNALYTWQAAVFICIYLVYAATVVAQDMQNQRRWTQSTAESRRESIASPRSHATSPADSVEEDFSYESDDSDLIDDPETRLLLGLNSSKTIDSPSSDYGAVRGDGLNRTDDDPDGPNPAVFPTIDHSATSSVMSSQASTPVSLHLGATLVLPAVGRPRADSTAAALKARSYVNVNEIAAEPLGPRRVLLAEVRRLFPLGSGQPWWKVVLVLVQAPIRLVLLLTVPVVQLEDQEWNKWLVVLQTMCSTVMMTAVVMDDAMKPPQHASHKVPPVVFGVICGVVLALGVAVSSERTRLPVYRIVFPFWGFTAASILVFAATDELVAVLRGFGSWYGLSPSFLGMVVIGVGNGLTDLIANLIVARHGWPSVAVSAIYGSSVLNIFVGIALTALVGVSKYGDPYKVQFDAQNLLGVCTNVLVLAVTVIFVWSDKGGGYFRKSCGICLAILYAAFLVGSITLEAVDLDTELDI